MDKYPRHMPVDTGKYAPELNDPETYYGLPQNVEFCSRCVISNQRPNSAVEFAILKPWDERPPPFPHAVACGYASAVAFLCVDFQIQSAPPNRHAGPM